jgi:hypothetical protein
VRLSVVALCAVTAAALGGQPPAGAASPCAQTNQGWLFNSYNQCGTLNGAKPTKVKLVKPAHITAIADYHFHNGVAVKPGTIGLMASNGYVFGPFRATQQTGTWDWIANMSITVPAGTYSVVDSSPSTWSQNAFSSGQGFVRVFGSFVTTAPPVPAAKAGGTGTATPAPAGPTCASSPPSTYLISPDRVAAGGSTSFLLACSKPVSFGFKGAFAPLKVLIYDEGSFRNLHYVNGYLQPISASFPVRPPVNASFTVAGPNDLVVVVPRSLAPGQYVAVIDDGKGEVGAQNQLVVT